MADHEMLADDKVQDYIDGRLRKDTGSPSTPGGR